MKNFIFLNMPGQQPFTDMPPFTNMPGRQLRPNRGDKSILQLSWTRLLLSIKGPALIFY